MCSRQAASSSESSDEMWTVYKTTRAFLLLTGQQICSWISVMRNQLLQRGLCGTLCTRKHMRATRQLPCFNTGFQVAKYRGFNFSVSSYKCHCAWTFRSETHYSVARHLNQAPQLLRVLSWVRTTSFTHDVGRIVFLLLEIYPL